MKHSDEFFATLSISKDYNSTDNSCPIVHNIDLRLIYSTGSR